MASTIAFDIIARDKASATFSKIGKASDSTSSRLMKLGKTAALGLGFVGVGSGLISFFKNSNAEARESQKVNAQTAAVLKSTGGAANVTAKQVGNLASAISRKSGIDDEAIQSASNLLLTFTNLRNEVGKGNDVFNQATQAATDMGAAMGKDPKSSAIQLGKALHDPIKGITALTRVGVTFTAQQKKQIETLVKSGQRMKAQKIILAELKKEFGGSAAAQATAADKAKVAWANLEEQVGTALIPVIDKLATVASEDVVPAISEFVTGMQDGTGAGGEFVDVITDLASIAKGAAKTVDSLPGPVKKFGAEALVAYIALRKLSGVTGSLSASLTSPIARTKQFAAEMTYAELRSAKLKGTMQRLGPVMKQAAGAGGAIALSNGLGKLNKQASQADTALGGLEVAAGAAAVGFAVGGPLGAAIGGTGGLVYGMVKTFGLFGTAAKRAATVSVPSWKQYEQTLDGVSAATTKATREMVYQRLESSGLLQATRALGLSDRDAINAMTGNHAARVKLTDAMRTSTKITQAQKDALEKETGAVGASRLAQLKHNVAIAGSSEELKKAKEALRKFMAQPASKRVSITGTEKARAQINSLRDALADLWSTAAGPRTSGPGGIDVLLNPGHNARGTSNWRGGLTWVGENGPELINAPKGSQIYPADKSARIAAGGSSAMSSASGGGVLGYLEVVHKTPDGKVIERELIELKNSRGGVRQLGFI